MKNTTFFLAIVVAMMFLLAVAHGQACNPEQDIPDCYPPFLQNGSPTPRCCEQLKQGKDCLCRYVDINRLKHLNPLYLRNIAGTCGVFFPICPDGQ
ncbi:hypothetical protein LXL04_031502 [Taraxacum kok-saghyz]